MGELRRSLTAEERAVASLLGDPDGQCRTCDAYLWIADPAEAPTLLADASRQGLAHPIAGRTIQICSGEFVAPTPLGADSRPYCWPATDWPVSPWHYPIDPDGDAGPGDQAEWAARVQAEIGSDVAAYRACIAAWRAGGAHVQPWVYATRWTTCSELADGLMAVGGFFGQQWRLGWAGGRWTVVR